MKKLIFVLTLMFCMFSISSAVSFRVTISKTSGGTVSGAENYETGEEVTLVAEPKSGYKFTGWTSIKGIELDNSEISELNFLMPANNVSMRANFKRIPTYKVTVSKTAGGTVSGGGSYKEGQEVTLNSNPKSGYEFAGWSRIRGIEVEDETSEIIEFEMPSNSVSIKAQFLKIANKVSVSKSGSGIVTGTGTYNRGEEVVLKAEAKSGYEFNGWTNIKGIEIENLESDEITFTMSLGAVSMKANFRKIPTYKVTVSKTTGGTVIGSGSYKEGEEVTLKANVTKNGYEFTGWSNIKGIELDDTTADEISFLMPANSVAIKANFQRVPTYKVSVERTSGGTVVGAGSYKEGERVTIKANKNSNYDFIMWSDIEGIELENTEADEISFTMPANSVSMKANFANFDLEPSIAIMLNGDSGFEKVLKLKTNNSTFITWGDGEFDYIPKSPMNEIELIHEYEDDEIYVIEILDNVVTYLNCENNYIYNIGLNKCTGITYLNCDLNNLTSLDVSNNKLLEYLSLNSNYLTNINVNNNTKLKHLGVSMNRLQNLNVLENKYLTYLGCESNFISSLDLTKNTKLEALTCACNRLTTLNLNNNDGLTYLNCAINGISELDLRNNRELETIECYENLIENLNLSRNTSLKEIYCSNNYLTKLDLSNNRKLEALYVSDNLLGVLDVSLCGNLEILNCYNNYLTSIDLTQNSKLKYLACYSNNISSLNITNNVNLESLYCMYNRIKVLNITNNLKLKQLYCTMNTLTTIMKLESQSPKIYKNANTNIISITQQQSENLMEE